MEEQKLSLSQNKQASKQNLKPVTNKQACPQL